MLASICLQVLARNVSPAAQLEESAFLTALVEEIRAAGPSKHTVVLDVGANDGEFSEELMRTLRKRANAQPELIMVEPQPRFAAKLGRIAKRWNGTHLPVAAWTEKKELVLQENAAHSEKSSLFQKTGKFAGLEQRTVQAIDFAAYLRETLRRADIAFVKIDIEGSEYDVLPTLLLGGLLCAPVRFLTLEWHLNFLPKTGSRRLGAVALRHALDGLLRAGCPAARPAPRVLHEEFRGVNFGKAVPGLLEEAARHASGCWRTRRGLPELCVLNGTAVGGLDWELTVRKAAIRHQLTLINGVR